MRKVVLVLLVICCFGGWALAEKAGFSNLIYGVVQGSKDLKAVYSQPVRVDYKKSALAFLGTFTASLLDKSVFAASSSLNFLDPVAEIITKTVEPIGLGIMYTAFGWKNKELARKIVGSSLFTAINTVSLKHLIGKARPYASSRPLYIGPNLKTDYNSFPSGHTSLSFSLATVLSSEYPDYSVLFYSWSSCVGLSRILLERHWIGDVVGGAITGTASARFYLESVREEP